MARTHAHTPAKFTADPDIDRHNARDEDVQTLAREHNRRDRHDARAAVTRGDYDQLAVSGGGRHSALWNA